MPTRRNVSGARKAAARKKREASYGYASTPGQASANKRLVRRQAGKKK